MIDVDTLHAAIQYPTNVILLFLAGAYLARARAIAAGQIVVGSPPVVRLTGLLLLVVGLKGLFWQIRWTARAFDLDAYAQIIDDWPLFATACNAAIVALGGMLLVMITRDVFGRRAEWIAGTIVAVLCAGGVVLVRGSGL